MVAVSPAGAISRLTRDKAHRAGDTVKGPAPVLDVVFMVADDLLLTWFHASICQPIISAENQPL